MMTPRERPPTAEPVHARVDVARLNFLQLWLHGANFAYEIGDDDTISALIFEWPENARVGADLRTTIDNAIAARGLPHPALDAAAALRGAPDQQEGKS